VESAATCRTAIVREIQNVTIVTIISGTIVNGLLYLKDTFFGVPGSSIKVIMILGIQGITS
jgi:hypothetical protein